MSIRSILRAWIPLGMSKTIFLILFPLLSALNGFTDIIVPIFIVFVTGICASNRIVWNVRKQKNPPTLSVRGKFHIIRLSAS